MAANASTQSETLGAGLLHPRALPLQLLLARSEARLNWKARSRDSPVACVSFEGTLSEAVLSETKRITTKTGWGSQHILRHTLKPLKTSPAPRENHLK